jgi:hypothetical protein
MPFVPGNSANPSGRPRGSHNKRTAEIYYGLQERGDLDPADYLSSIVTNPTKPDELRMQAANMLMPYMHSKAGVLPAKLFVKYTINLPYPKPDKLDQVRENIVYLTALKLTEQIDTATADNLILDQTKIHDSIFEEMKLLYSTGGGTDVQIHIEGGLPDMPGTNIIKPDLSGNDPLTLLDSDHGRVDAPPEPTTINAVANPAPSAEKLPVQPCGAATPAKVPPAKILEPTAAVGAAVAPLAGNGQPPVQPPPPTLKSEVPQLAADIRPEHRATYLAERQVRFTHTPNLWVWDGFLWIDAV